MLKASCTNVWEAFLIVNDELLIMNGLGLDFLLCVLCAFAVREIVHAK
jgi:hypothetical protein